MMTTIDHNFLIRVIKTTAFVTLVVALFSFSYYNIYFALGLVVGSIFNIINFWFIKALVTSWVTTKPASSVKVAVLVLVKFPLLYGAGFVILKSGIITAESFLCGFSLLFVVLILKVLGIILMAKNTKSDSSHSSESKMDK